MAPSLEGQEALICLQGGLAGLLQLVVDEALVGSLGEPGSCAASRWGEESMVRLKKREKELADSIL